MRVLFFMLVFLPVYLLTISVQAAVPPADLNPDDIARDPTSRAIVTFAAASGGIHMMNFRHVPDLRSCFALAYTAAKKGSRESTATCLDVQGKAVGAYSCSPVLGSNPHCRAGFP